ncbi:MAG: carbohydrate kinase [Armatimonadetes bacterium]|nr:carbohydrate kinase [Armatimonadota bacterium]
MNENLFENKKPKPVCVGTGLVALDVVINGSPGSPPKLWAGGSCGNVLTILSYLGWKTYPIARLGDDVAAAELLKDMRRWKVKTNLISLDKSNNTPIIVEKIGVSRSGMAWHRFEWICPNCGSWLPKYKPVLVKDLESIYKKMTKPQVFYFDRVARSSVELAKVSKRHGALIMFEPSGIKDKKLFLECLKVADIVKYSHERLGHAQELTQEKNIPLEIETLGAEGLRYRLGHNKGFERKWKFMVGYQITNLKDAAGSGDWCSAGIIYLLGDAGKESFENVGEKDIEAALSFGQALAALNCSYEGARGVMYGISKQEFEARVRDIWNGMGLPESKEQKEVKEAERVFKCICPNCAKINTKQAN